MNAPNVQHAFALDLQSANLANKFGQCPPAEQLMQAAAALSRIFIDISPSFQSARTLFSYDSEKATLLEAQIEIPAHKHYNESFSSLAHELLNVAHYPKMQPIYFNALRGELGMDAYAASLELAEDRSVVAHDLLMQQCASTWEIPWDGTRGRIEDLQLRLWDAEIKCHTDMLRRRWIALHQTAYCEKHPSDLRSCTTKPGDLCDFDLLNSLPVSQQNYVHFLRLCARLPAAGELIQKSYEQLNHLCQQLQHPLLGSAP